MEIIGYENYLIYEDGRVYNKKYNRFLKPATNRGGYKYVNLSKQGKYKTHTVHRLLAEHYINNPENKKYVDHINRIRSDNRLENLRWATHTENNQNKTISKNNISGHQNISYHKQSDGWVFQKSFNKTTRKYFKSKTDALCYKFIILLKIKSLLI